MNKTPLQKQWDKLLIKEADYLKKCAKKSPSKLDNFLSSKVPDKLQATLNTAFSKSFALIFEKGTNIIEKSYSKEEIMLKNKVNAYAFSLRQDNKRVRAFEKETTKSEAKNVVISGVKGVGLGLLGIGLPDIPIFIGMILKGIYEIALQYGYDYESEEERYFILSVISTALQYGVDALNGNRAINDFIETPLMPKNYDQTAKITAVANVLSTELLIMKFLQGVPLVGAVGGVYDAVFVKKILDFAKMKYKRRFLYSKTNIQELDI